MAIVAGGGSGRAEHWRSRHPVQVEPENGCGPAGTTTPGVPTAPVNVVGIGNGTVGGNAGPKRGPGLRFVQAVPAYDLAVEAAKLTDARRAALHLDTDRCIPSREAMEESATI